MKQIGLGFMVMILALSTFQLVGMTINHFLSTELLAIVVGFLATIAVAELISLCYVLGDMILEGDRNY